MKNVKTKVKWKLHDKMLNLDFGEGHSKGYTELLSFVNFVVVNNTSAPSYAEFRRLYEKG